MSGHVPSSNLSAQEKYAKALLEKVSEPHNYGPIWYLIHKEAKYADESGNYQQYEDFLHRTEKNLRCDDCRNHAIQDSKDHPVRPWFGVRDDKSGVVIGCLKHSWMKHNRVNKRIGKKEIDWITCLLMYNDTEGCSTCGHASISVNRAKETKIKPPNKIKVVGRQ